MKNYIFYTIFFVVGVSAVTLLNFDPYLYKMIFSFVMIIVLAWLFFKEAVIILPFFISYMLNVQVQNFDKKIEKPRLLFYILFGLSAVISLVTFYYLENDNIFDQLASVAQILMFTISAYLLYFSWNNKFIVDLIPQMQKKFFTESKYFQIGWSEDQLKDIFNRLNENNFIEILSEYDVLDYDFFKDNFLLGKIPDEQLFKLNMDHIQTKYFFDLFSSRSKGFTLDDFLCFFKNKNGIVIRPNIESSYSKSKKNPKQKDLLDQIIYF